MFFFLPLLAALVAPARALDGQDLGVRCTPPPPADAPKVKVTPKPGVKPNDIAAATNAIPVGTFSFRNTDYTLRCKGAGSALSCSGVTEGQAAMPACMAGVSPESVVMSMAAMNMQFLAVIPTTALFDPATTMVNWDEWE